MSELYTDDLTSIDDTDLLMQEVISDEADLLYLDTYLKEILRPQ
jgi:hypothetical protein